MQKRSYSILSSDAYKFSMSEAGAPLRQETFYYTDESSYEYLKSHNYELGAGSRKALESQDSLKILSIPKGSWFYNREPAFSAEGCSIIPSWLEPLSLTLQYRIQLATAFKNNTPNWENKILFATCQEEKDIIEETLDSLMSSSISIKAGQRYKIEVRSAQYYDDVLARAKELVKLVEDPNRIFEVGMRGVSCMEQHEIALQAIKDAGIIRTSNVAAAKKLGMLPVGTMGHEHIQRHGSDYAAYTAMRDRFPGFLFYLPDTFDTIRSGIPAALKVIQENPERNAGIRFDSETGIRGHYMFTVIRARELGLEPILALESGWNYELTKEFEELRKLIGWRAERQAYGFGYYLVKPSWDTFARDDVAAVWKISQTGSRATMKFGDEPNSAKESIPGKPVIYRTKPAVSGEVVGYVYQEGEPLIHFDAYLLSGREDASALYPGHAGQIIMSLQTQLLINECRAARARVLQEC